MTFIQDCGVGLLFGVFLCFQVIGSKIKLGSAIIRSCSDFGIVGLLV